MSERIWVSGVTVQADDQPPSFSFTPFDAVGTVKQDGGSNWLHVPIPYNTSQVLEQVEMTVVLGPDTTVDLINLRGALQGLTPSLQAYPNPRIVHNAWRVDVPATFRAGPLDLVVHVNFGMGGSITICGVAITVK